LWYVYFTLQTIYDYENKKRGLIHFRFVFAPHTLFLLYPAPTLFTNSCSSFLRSRGCSAVFLPVSHLHFLCSFSPPFVFCKFISLFSVLVGGDFQCRIRWVLILQIRVLNVNLYHIPCMLWFIFCNAILFLILFSNLN
jgi:hypothetical protein